MADITLTLTRTPATAPAVTRPAWLDRLVHHFRVRRRRARRNRYLALIGRAPRRPDWVGEMARAMGGRM
jgi:hypothetical protein